MAQADDYLSVLAVAVAGGPIVALVVGLNSTEERCGRFIRWGILMGLVTACFFGIHYLFGVQSIHAKGLAWLMFVGGPVGVAALLLSVRNRLRRQFARAGDSR